MEAASEAGALRGVSRVDVRAPTLEAQPSGSQWEMADPRLGRDLGLSLGLYPPSGELLKEKSLPFPLHATTLARQSQWGLDAWTFVRR